MDVFESHRGSRLELSALGTVLQRFSRHAPLAATSLEPGEQRLLEGMSALGFPPADFFAVRKLAQFARRPSAHLLALLLCELMACAEGSTYLRLEREPLSARLEALGMPEKERAAFIAELPRLMSEEPGLFARADASQEGRPFIVGPDSNALYRAVFFRAETGIAESLRPRMAQAWTEFGDLREAFIHITETAPLGTCPWSAESGSAWKPIRLSAEQQLAVLVGVQAPLTLVSGGPGTGKTSVVVSMLRLLLRLGVAPDSIAIAAPTGRAARRMSEAIHLGLDSVRGGPGEDGDTLAALPQTVHRLLGIRSRQSLARFSQSPTLTASYLLIDEGSMLDMVLMDRLLGRIKPEAKVILLGDADQLPSVDAGAVFRDLTETSFNPWTGTSSATSSEAVWQALDHLRERPAGQLDRHLVRLRQTFRQSRDDGGRHILELAGRIKQGDPAGIIGSDLESHVRVLGSGQEPLWRGVELVEPGRLGPAGLLDLLESRFYAEISRQARQVFVSVEDDRESLLTLFGLFDSLRILCLTHRTRFGVESINQMLSEKHDRSGSGFFSASPWMVTRNDHRLKLYNGDLGLGLWFKDASGEPSRRLVFRRQTGFLDLPFESMGGLVPAFAVTVHKSQGSEADHVVLILPEQINALCKRELIYTAITRAKRSVLIFGKPDVLKAAVSQTMDRASNLTQRLGQSGEALWGELE